MSLHNCFASPVCAQPEWTCFEVLAGQQAKVLENLFPAQAKFIRFMVFPGECNVFLFLEAVRLARYFRSCLTGQRCFYATCPFGQAIFPGQFGNDGLAERFVPAKRWHLENTGGRLCRMRRHNTRLS
jgi:hypothetical protein